MNKQKFINIIKDPTSLSNLSLDELESVVENFPYFQSAHILIAKISHERGSMLASKKLSKAAAYSLDRKALKRVLQGREVDKLKNTRDSSANLFKVAEGFAKSAPMYEDSSSIAVAIEEAPTEELMVEKENFQIQTSSIDITKETTGFNIAPKPTNDIRNSSTVSFFEELERNLLKLKELKENPSAFDSLFKINAEGKEGSIKDSIPVIKAETPSSTEPVDSKNQILVEDYKNEPIETSQAIENSKSEDENTSVDENRNTNSQKNDLFLQEDVLKGEHEVSSKEAQIMLEYLDFLNSSRPKPQFVKKSYNHLIDKFIKEDPSIPYMDNSKLDREVEDLTEKNSKPVLPIISENYAKILIRQGRHEQAIDVYNQLILKNPEKKFYFAAIIEEIKNKN